MRRIFLLSAAVVAGAFFTSFLAHSGAVAAGPDDSPRFVPGEVLVSYRGDATAHERTRAVWRVGGAPVEVIHTRAMREAGDRPITRLRIDVPMDQALATLRSDPNVEFAEPNYIVHHDNSNDTYYTSGNLWGMYGSSTSPANQYGSQAGEAWAKNQRGSASVIVGVIDEGIDVSHVELKGNIFTNPGETVDGVDNDGNGYVDDINGWDFVNNDRTVYDGGNGDKHGTHVAGTIGAAGNNGAGVAGVCWSVKIVSLKFLGRNGGTTANAIKAIDYLTDLKGRHGLNIVASNNSWGGGGFSSALSAAITRAGAADILFVAAAGNGGNDGVGDNNDSVPHYPSSYTHSNIISVASITSTGAKSGFSNYGANSVDLAAPGSSILSTLPKNTYGTASGTSMACPHVTGAVALYKAAFPTADATTTRNTILGTVIPTASMSGRTTTGGRLNVGDW